MDAKGLLLTLALAGAVGSGCRSTKAVLADYEANVSYGRYAEAAVEPAKLAAEGGKDALCWQLNAAGAEHLAGRVDEAILGFDRAEDLFIDFDGRGTVSAAADGTWSMMTGDYTMPYAGNGQDRIFTCLYKAIDFGVKGNVAAMRTELNRALQHQAKWRDQRSAEVTVAAERMNGDAQAYARKAGTSAAQADGAAEKALADPGFAATIAGRTGFDPARDGRLENLADDDFTNRYLERVNAVFRRYVGDVGQKPSGMVTVFVEDGLCPVREEWRLDLPLILIPGLNSYVQYAGMALPVLKYRNEAVTAYAVEAGGTSYAMPLIQDVDRLVKTEFDIAFRGALTREITRAVIRVAAQAALGAVAESQRHSNNDAYVLFSLLQLGVAAWSYGTTDADLRCWASLPKRVYMLDVPQPPDGVISVRCGQETIRVNVPAGNTLVFVRKPSSAAPAVVKSFTFPN